MSWLRTFMLFRILQNSKDTELAERDQSGEPICGGCQTHVDPQATKCDSCGANLYTRRGKLARNSFSVFGVLMILWGVMAESSLALLAVIPGALCLYLWWSLRSDAPNRELNLGDRIPLIGNSDADEGVQGGEYTHESGGNGDTDQRYRTESSARQSSYYED